MKKLPKALLYWLIAKIFFQAKSIYSQVLFILISLIFTVLYFKGYCYCLNFLDINYNFSSFCPSIVSSLLRWALHFFDHLLTDFVPVPVWIYQRWVMHSTQHPRCGTINTTNDHLILHLYRKYLESRIRLDFSWAWHFGNSHFIILSNWCTPNL